MDNEANKVIFKKNSDGTTKKVFIRKKFKKVAIKIKKGPTEKATPVTTTEKKSNENKKTSFPKKTYSQDKTRQNNKETNNRPKYGEKPKKKILVTRKKETSSQSFSLNQNQYYGKTANNNRQHLKDKNFSNIQKDEVNHEEKENFDKFNHTVKDKSKVDEYANVPTSIEIPEVISIKDLAHKMNLKISQLIKKFFSMGVMDVTVNDSIDAESAQLVCSELNCKLKVVSLLEQTKVDIELGDEKDYIERSPIITVMGHVDHGKTSLLDAIRSTNVAEGESGGITQHIAAYSIKTKKGNVTFIDTPGHSAFSSMRARGAKITDIIVLVVSAVDGVKPQTLEAIKYAKDANLPIIVAINKCDLQDADPSKIKSQLSEHGVVSEKWGGDVIFHNISALKKEGITELLESIAIQSEIHEIKGNPKIKAFAYVIESRVEVGKGNVVTIIIKNGCLRTGDVYICDVNAGKVRAMFDENGNSIKKAGLSQSVEIIGIPGLPRAGETFQVMNNEKDAKKIVERRIELLKQKAAQKVKKVNVNNLFDTIKAEQIKELKILLKGDVYGTLEALREELLKQKNDEVKVTVVSSSTGGVTENDVNLAGTSEAMIMGFKVKPNAKAKKLAEHQGVEICTYNIIYDAIDFVKEKLKGMLKKHLKEERIGVAEVKEVFKISDVGKIAGCLVVEGKVTNDATVKIYREDEIIIQSKVAVLKHYKDNVKEIRSGSECGIQIDNFQDLKSGDKIECYLVSEIERELKTQA